MSQWIRLSSAYVMLLVFLTVPYPESAQAQSQNLDPIGQVENGALLRRGIGGTEEFIQLNGHVFKGDMVTTSRGNGAVLVFNDGTRLEVGSQSKVVIRDYEYTHNGSGIFDVIIFKGCLNYQSGVIGNMTVASPSMILGAQGPTQFMLLVTRSVQTNVVHQEGYIVVNDINGENPLTLDVPGEVGSATLSGSPQLVMNGSSEVIQAVGECLQVNYNQISTNAISRRVIAEPVTQSELAAVTSAIHIQNCQQDGQPTDGGEFGMTVPVCEYNNLENLIVLGFKTKLNPSNEPVSRDSSQLLKNQAELARSFEIIRSSNGSSLSIKNGEHFRSRFHNFLLKPLQDGDVVIPALEWEEGFTGTLKLNVVPVENEEYQRSVRQLGFVESEVNTDRMRLTDKLFYTVRLFSRAGITFSGSMLAALDNAAVNGTEPIPKYTRTIGGYEYEVREIVQEIRPTSPGDIHIPTLHFLLNLGVGSMLPTGAKDIHILSTEPHVITTVFEVDTEHLPYNSVR